MDDYSYRPRPRNVKHVTLPPEDEEMVRNLRDASRRARRKMEDLEDEVTSRERAYASEAAFRRAMDERVPATRVVDMYNNEDVNAELHSRLPRSGDRSFSYRPSSLPPERLPASSERGALLLSPNVTGAPLILSPVSMPFGDSGSRRATDRDESRQISTLISELDAVKEDNRRLQTRLAESSREVDEAKAAALTSKAELDALVAAQVSEAIQEIRSAQKSRDEAMMARLRVANEERDAAIERVHRYAAESPAETEKPIDAQQYRNTYQKYPPRDEDNSLATLRAERDEAVQKYHQLLQEFNSHQKGNTDFGQVVAERDDALRKLRTMEDEIQTLRVYYSLHKSLSPEMIASQMGTHSLDQLRNDLQAALCREDALTAELERLRQETEAALSDRDRAEADLAKSKRLVTVLRRKLNAADSTM